MKGLEADIWGETFEHYMTLQNPYKMFSDPPGILRKKLLQVHKNPSNENFNGTFYLSLDFFVSSKMCFLKSFPDLLFENMIIL